MKKRILREPIYGSAVLFLSGDGEQCREAAAHWFESLSLEHNAEAFSNARAGTFRGGDMHWAVWVKDANDMPSLMHEAVHVGVALMEEIGHPITKESDEPLAYYCDWLVGEALKK